LERVGGRGLKYDFVREKNVGEGLVMIRYISKGYLGQKIPPIHESEFYERIKT
jgi:hypothetical protein